MDGILVKNKYLFFSATSPRGPIQGVVDLPNEQLKDTADFFINLMSGGLIIQCVHELTQPEYEKMNTRLKEASSKPPLIVPPHLKKM